MIKLILNNQKYSNEHFLGLIKKSVGENYLNINQVYKDIKEGRKNEMKIPVKSASKLLESLKKEVEELDKKRKKASKRN